MQALEDCGIIFLLKEVYTVLRDCIEFNGPSGVGAPGGLIYKRLSKYIDKLLVNVLL